MFPHYFGNILGIGLETFGHGSEITFSSAQAGTLPSTNLWVFSTMLNLTLRYPWKAFVPYIGVGGGYSRRSAHRMPTSLVGLTEDFAKFMGIRFSILRRIAGQRD